MVRLKHMQTFHSLTRIALDLSIAALQDVWAALTKLNEGDHPFSFASLTNSCVVLASRVAHVPAPSMATANSTADLARTSSLLPPFAITPVATPVPTTNESNTLGPWVAGPVYHVVPPNPLVGVAQGENESDGPWYCITRGQHVGVTLSNALAVAAISGISRGMMNKHKTQAQAVAAFNEALEYNLVGIVTR